MANILQVPVPVGSAAIVWPSRSSDVNSLLFINQDLNNTIWIGQESAITAAGPNTIPIQPNGTFSGDASSPWYVIGSIAGTQPLVVVPNGQAYFLGLTQGAGQLAIPSVRSPNFTHGSAGWQIAKDGSAEFNNVIFRGTFAGGELIITQLGVFFYNGAPAAGNNPIFAVVGPGVTLDPFGNQVIAVLNVGNQGLVGSHLGIDGNGNLYLNNSGGIMQGGQVWALPTGDTTGAADANFIDGMLNDGYAVHLIPGIYYVNRPIIPPTKGSLIGAGGSVNNSSVIPGAITRIVATSGFTPSGFATGVISMVGNGLANPVAGQVLKGFTIDCSAAPASVDGIAGYSQVNGVVIEDVAVYKATGRGLACIYDGTSGQPDGWRIRGLLCSQCTGDGAFFQAADMIIQQMAVIGCAGDGWNINNLANSILTGCRAQNNGGNGWHFKWANGGTSGYLLMNGCGSDQNHNNGWFFDVTTTTLAVTLNGCASNTDGQAGGAQTGIVVLNTCDLTILINGWGSTANATGPATGASLTGGGYVSVANALFAGLTTALGGNPQNWRAIATRTGAGAITQIADSA